jgi:hypothetical protein
VTQYINLVNPEFRPRREWLTAASLIATLAVIGIALAAGNFIAKGRSQDLQAELVAVDTQLRSDQERLAVAGRAVASAQPNPQLAAEVESTREKLRVLDASMAEVASGALGDTAGFSEQFRAFARQSTDGLWLTGFTLSGAGKDMVINGRTLDADRVPAYIRRLSGESAFRGKSFDVLVIAEGKPDGEAKTPPSKPPGTAPRAAGSFLEFQLVSSADLAGKREGSSQDLSAIRKTEESKR